MFKKFSACLVVLLVLASGSWAAESSLWSSHITDAALVDGKSNFSQVTFSEVRITINADELTAESGTITFPDGGFTLIDDEDNSLIETVAKGTSKTLNLVNNDGEYKAAADNGNIVGFEGEADANLAGQNITWTFPAESNLNGGSAKVPSFRTTLEQMSEAVPYIELIMDGDNVTGLKYRVVKASDPDTEIKPSYVTDFRLGYRIYGTATVKSDWQNDKTSGEYTFEEPVALSRVGYFFARLRTHEDENNPCIYTWKFHPEDEAASSLWSSHLSRADLIEGESSFTKAIFSQVQMNIGKQTEAESGTITVTGGGYTLVNDDTDEVIEEVAEGTEKTFALKKDSDTEYIPATDDGDGLAFVGDADKNLAGQAVLWTFDEYIYGAAKFPAFRTTESQLAEAVPYIKAVIADGKITGVNYRVIKASAPDTEIKPSYQTDFRLGYKTKSDKNIKSDWQNDKTSGEYTFEESVAESELKYLYARLRTHEDNNTCIYTWRFYPKSNPSDPDPVIPDPNHDDKKDSNNVLGSSSGGCNGGFGLLTLAGLITLAGALKFRR